MTCGTLKFPSKINLEVTGSAWKKVKRSQGWQLRQPVGAKISKYSIKKYSFSMSGHSLRSFRHGTKTWYRVPFVSFGMQQKSYIHVSPWSYSYYFIDETNSYVDDHFYLKKNRDIPLFSRKPNCWKFLSLNNSCLAI